MRFVPKSPVVFVLIVVAFFVSGMLFGKMFGKKADKFDPYYIGEPPAYMGEFNTPSHMDAGPKVLPKVPETRGVVSGEEWCKKFNC